MCSLAIISMEQFPREDVARFRRVREDATRMSRVSGVLSRCHEDATKMLRGNYSRGNSVIAKTPGYPVRCPFTLSVALGNHNSSKLQTDKLSQTDERYACVA